MRTTYIQLILGSMVHIKYNRKQTNVIKYGGTKIDEIHTIRTGKHRKT